VTGQGGTAGIRALLANDIQMVSSAGDLLAAAALRGGETVMIAAGINKGLQRILTVPEIKAPADLKGKRVRKGHAKARGADPKSFVDDSLLRETEASGL
jgi:ABC-type nitrate/sulfonate/bicarbonate transport system substrate-binding protein